MNALPYDDGTAPWSAADNPAQPDASGVRSIGGGLPAVSAGPVCDVNTLVLFDSTGPYSWLGELYAVAAGNLASHFGAWTAKPVALYSAGDLSHYTAAIYVGSTYDQALPTAFLDDVLQGTTPVTWLYNNIWQLVSRASNFVGTYGYTPWAFDSAAIAEVRYKGRSLTRYAPNGGGIMSYTAVDPTKASVLALAVKSDGTTFPWGIRSHNLTYIGENPFAYISENDRYLAFCDLLFDALAPMTPERHRALVRIEDVDAYTDPGALRAIADYLWSRSVPFSIAVIPVYVDPAGVRNNGVPETVRLRDAPLVVDALKYMISKGGTAIMHGYTHQHESVPNPYSGVSADDFEFYLAHVDASDYVIYDGPVSQDSAVWASGRITSAFQEFSAVGLPKPTIFEYPHYAGSAADSRAIQAQFSTVYHRGLYFGGVLAGGPDDYTRPVGQFFPYVVRDAYGWTALPENLGSYEPIAYNHHPARLSTDLIGSAQANLVVRDGFASFYFHPYLPLNVLQETVEGIQGVGYSFADPKTLM